MTITYHEDLIQGSEEWFSARRGLLTASEMKLIITPTLKIADNDKSRAHVYELAAQRITGYVEPTYISDDMLRGHVEEVEAAILYEKHHAPVKRMGFVTNNKWGFTLGYSPDGLVGGDGAIECKSRRQKYQIETIVKNVMPEDYVIQVQAGLLVTERAWCDFISYCGGMPMMTLRVYPDDVVQKAILDAAATFHDKLDALIKTYSAQISAPGKMFIPTVRTVEEAMI